jgi:glycosyltransferase involved in cell wall biosynthesis
LAPYIDHPSFNLSLPNKLIEYLSGGLPVISSIEGTLGRLLREEECGATYGSAEELAAILRRLSQDQSELERLSKNASALYKARFVAENVYGKMADYLEEMAKAGR